MRHRNRRGAAMMEGALVMTVFLLMMFGVIEFGRLIWIHTTLTAAAREAGRWAMVHGEAGVPVATEALVQDYARGKAVGLDPVTVAVTTVWTPNKKSGSEVRVTVNHTFQPLIGSFVGLGVMNLSSSSRVIITQ